MELVTIGEVELAYELAGSGPPLVWCHGLASCVDGDHDIVEALASSFSVLAYDARGHGRSSPVRDPSAFTYRHLADDLVALLARVGWERAVLAGASMGAATCARVAALHPGAAQALVMTRPAAMGDDGAAPGWLQLLFAGGAHAIRTGGIDAAIEFLMSIPAARAELERDPARVTQLRTDWERHDPLSIAAALDAIPRSPATADGATAEKIACPTLIIPGNDLIHPTAAANAVAARIARAQTAVPFDSLPRDREVAQMAAVVREFVRRTSMADA